MGDVKKPFRLDDLVSVATVLRLKGSIPSPDADGMTAMGAYVEHVRRYARGLERALRKAAAQFRLYTKLHAAKGTEDGNEKARVNAEFGTMCEAALVGAPSPDARISELKAALDQAGMELMEAAAIVAANFPRSGPIFYAAGERARQLAQQPEATDS